MKAAAVEELKRHSVAATTVAAATRREVTAEQTATEQLADQQKRVHRWQQKKATMAAGEGWVDEWEVAGYFSEEGYYSGSNSDCSSGDREAEVAATW